VKLLKDRLEMATG